VARVLIVEDDTGLQRFLCEVLEEVPADCDCVTTRAKAETALQANRYDLVIADVRLPDGSGHDVASLASAAGTKTLLMSGYPDDITALTASAVEHLGKPFRVSAFIEMIKRQLGP
jgi:DNA-binding response OmpR family regulator